MQKSIPGHAPSTTHNILVPGLLEFWKCGVVHPQCSPSSPLLPPGGRGIPTTTTHTSQRGFVGLASVLSHTRDSICQIPYCIATLQQQGATGQRCASVVLQN